VVGLALNVVARALVLGATQGRFEGDR
jgi:hypothetical protein